MFAHGGISQLGGYHQLTRINSEDMKKGVMTEDQLKRHPQ